MRLEKNSSKNIEIEKIVTTLKRMEKKYGDNLYFACRRYYDRIARKVF